LKWGPRHLPPAGSGGEFLYPDHHSIDDDHAHVAGGADVCKPIALDDCQVAQLTGSCWGGPPLARASGPNCARTHSGWICQRGSLRSSGERMIAGRDLPSDSVGVIVIPDPATTATTSSYARSSGLSLGE